MENLEQTTSNVTDTREPIIINTINVNKFIALSLITFGLYDIWWIYKSWRFIRDQEKSEILPAFRTIFSLFFLISLFKRILKLAKSSDYKFNYPSVILFIGYILTGFLSYLPEPFFIVALVSFVFLIPPFKALKYAIANCDGFKENELRSFNGRQTFILVISGILWTLFFIGIIIA
jgi:hypothetical protein